jgi:Protein of unknown function (DUF1631)
MDSNDLLASTRAEFFKGFMGAVQKALPLSAEELFKKADRSYSSGEQKTLLNARAVLLDKWQSDQLWRELTRGMERLLNRSFQTTYSTFRPKSAMSFQADRLSLVDESTYDDELRIDNLTNLFRRESDELLRDLNIRIALLFEQDSIKERENPFRPYLFTRCILSAVESLNIDADEGVILGDQIAQSLSPEIADIYADVNEHLAKHGIAAQLQLRVKKTASSGAFDSAIASLQSGENSDVEMVDANPNGEATFSAGRAANAGNGSEQPARRLDQLFQSVRQMSSGGAGNSAAQGSSGASDNDSYSEPFAQGELGYKLPWLQSGQSVGGVLRQLFSNPTPRVTTDNSSSTYAVAQSVQRMQRDGTPATGAMIDSRGEVRNLILERRHELTQMTESVDDQMTIDVVAMLFEFILRDNQVPAEVRAQLGRLQFMVLKVALRDATLLTQKGHPARTLVNRIGSISIGLKQLDPTGEQITDEICRIVEALLEDESDNPQIFSRMLDEFDAFIARELRVVDKSVDRAVEAVEQVQGRTLRFARIVAQMAEALSTLPVEPYLLEFLENTWVRAIELAERTDYKIAQRYRVLVPDLLWSIVPKVDKDDKTQLFALLPTIIRTMREAMTLIGWNENQQKGILDWLVEAHTFALRGAQFGVRVQSLRSLHEHFFAFVNDVENPNKITDVNLESLDLKVFMDDAIKQLDVEVQMLDSMVAEEFGNETFEGARVDGVSSLDGIKEQLKNGVPIELNLGGKPSAARLNWVNPNLSNLVLTISDQPTPSLVGAKVFRRMLERGRVRFLEAEPLFDRAVESLLKSADTVDGGAALAF